MQRKKRFCQMVMCAVMFMTCAMYGTVVDAGDSPDAGVQVSPIRYDWQMTGGDTQTGKIYVHNFSQITHHVEVSIEDFYVTDDSSEAKYYVPDGNHPLKAYDIINWIKEPEDFTLAPGETKEVEFQVTVPEGQPTSGYYGIVFFKTRADDAAAEDDGGGAVKIGVSYRVGVLLTLAVQGDEPMRISGQTDEVNVGKRVFWKSPINVYARLRSDGNIHYKAGGQIDVRKFGKKYSTIKIDPEVMYPGKTRLITRNVPTQWWDYGIYTAELDMRSEDGSVVFNGHTERFYVFPWMPASIFVGAIVLIITLIRVIKKKFKIVRR